MFFWAIFYGVIAGIVFKIHGCIKDWLYICTTYLRQWKRYPKRSYEKYINSLLFEIKNLSEYVYKEAILKKQKKTQPFPFFAILTVTIVNLTIIPFRLISSIIDGPMIVFTDAIDYWKLHILKIDPYQKRYSDWLSEAETIHEKKS
ncbi:MAG: hypothetical protein WC860_08570 [Candidatus Margulisiibacteriota bacterium]